MSVEFVLYIFLGDRSTVATATLLDDLPQGVPNVSEFSTTEQVVCMFWSRKGGVSSNNPPQKKEQIGTNRKAGDFFNNICWS